MQKIKTAADNFKNFGYINSSALIKEAEARPYKRSCERGTHPGIIFQRLLKSFQKGHVSSKIFLIMLMQRCRIIGLSRAPIFIGKALKWYFLGAVKIETILKLNNKGLPQIKHREVNRLVNCSINMKFPDLGDQSSINSWFTI